MAVLTDQQAKMAVYAGGAIIAFIWLRAQGNGNSLAKQAAKDTVDAIIETAKGVGEALGTEVIKPTAKVVAQAAAKPFKAIYSGMETEFLMTVEGMGDIKLKTVGEKQLALEYMNLTAQAVDSVPLLGVWSAVNGYRAAQAVKEYRNNKGNYQPWGVQ